MSIQGTTKTGPVATFCQVLDGDKEELTLYRRANGSGCIILSLNGQQRYHTPYPTFEAALYSFDSQVDFDVYRMLRDEGSL
jgi:hypothetical protein